MCVLVFGLTVPFANAQGCSPTAPNAILDGGFEGGDDWNPPWNIQTSTNFGTPICDLPTCGVEGMFEEPIVPFMGTNWIWFSTLVEGDEEFATVGQTFNVASPSIATLRFWLRISEVDAPFDATLDILLDGNPIPVQTFTEPSTPEGAYTQRTVFLPVLTAGNHTIVFDYADPAGDASGFTSFMVDDISLNLCTPTATTASISGRVIASRRAVPNAKVALTDQFGVTRTATTNGSGQYQFDDVLVGQTYVLRVVARRNVFSAQVITLDSSMTGVNFVAGQ